jgi:hypothetical protein
MWNPFNILLASDPPTQMDEPTISTQTVGEAYVWARLTAKLHANPEIAAICRILNTVEQRQGGVPIKDFYERDLTDARRLVDLASATINALDPEIVHDAVENVAHLLLADGDSLALFECQSVRVQTHYRRLAQSAFNAIQNTLERLS